MCRHCERIVEHPEDRPIMHAFMELTAKRIRERTGHSRLTADNIDIDIKADLFAYDSLGDVEIHKKGTGTGTGKPYESETARTAIMRMLAEMHK